MENIKETHKVIIRSLLRNRDGLKYHNSKSKCLTFGNFDNQITWVDISENEIYAAIEMNVLSPIHEVISITDAPDEILEIMAHIFCPRCLSAEINFAKKILEIRRNDGSR